MRLLKKFVAIAILIAMMPLAPQAAANPVGDFFQRIGRSLSHLLEGSPPPQTKKKSTGKKHTSAGTSSEKSREVLATTPTEKPTPTPVDIRPAARAVPDPTGRRDVPYGVAVPNQPGLVASPYAPTQGFVDVRAFPSSTEVVDPFTGKIFLTP